MDFKKITVFNHPTIVGSISGSSETCVLVIPGNPGSPYFYTPFCESIQKHTGYSVFTMSHFGHTADTLVTSSNTKNSDLQGDFSEMSFSGQNIRFFGQKGNLK